MMLYSILVAVDVLLAIGIIGLVLIQHGKGADVGAAFGSGASGTVFGARGSATFLTRATAILATLFFANSLLLAYLATHRPVTESVIDQSAQVIEEVVEAPVEESPQEERVMPESTVSDLPDVPQVNALQLTRTPTDLLGSLPDHVIDLPLIQEGRDSGICLLR